MSEGELPIRPRAGCGFLMALTLFVFGVAGLYIGMLIIGARGRPAEGETVRMAFTGCAAARELVEERVAAMGLGGPAWEDTGGGFAVTARLPADPHAVEEIPATLAAVGRFEVRAGDASNGTLVADQEHIDSAFMRLDLTVSPRTAILFDKEAGMALARHTRDDPNGILTFWLDGEAIGTRQNHPELDDGRVEIEPVEREPEAKVRMSAARAMVLEHGPLPCPLTVTTEVVSSTR